MLIITAPYLFFWGCFLEAVLGACAAGWGGEPVALGDHSELAETGGSSHYALYLVPHRPIPRFSGQVHCLGATEGPWLTDTGGFHRGLAFTSQVLPSPERGPCVRRGLWAPVLFPVRIHLHGEETDEQKVLP